MAKRKRRSFTDEFKADAVRLVHVGDRTPSQVAKDLDLTESALRTWVHSAALAAPTTKDPLTSAEREEWVRLRRDNKRLLMEREILKKAAAFFAKENG